MHCVRLGACHSLFNTLVLSGSGDGEMALHNYCCMSVLNAPLNTGSSERQATPSGRATPAPHSSPRCPGERRVASAKLSDGERLQVPSRRRVARPPGKFLEAFLFRGLLFESSVVEKGV